LKLKKVGKDKAAKKKLQDEIQKQEQEMQLRHTQELEEWNKLNNKITEEKNEPDPQLKEKMDEVKGMSKTQKRRVSIIILFIIVIITDRK